MSLQPGINDSVLPQMTLQWPNLPAAVSPPLQAPVSVLNTQPVGPTTAWAPVATAPASYPWEPAPTPSEANQPPATTGSEVMARIQLQTLTSELASIRESIKELKRTQGEPALPEETRGSSSFLSDTIARLAASRSLHPTLEAPPPLDAQPAVALAHTLAPSLSAPAPAYSTTSGLQVPNSQPQSIATTAPLSVMSMPAPTVAAAPPKAAPAAPAPAPVASPAPSKPEPSVDEPAPQGERSALDLQTKRLVRKQRNKQAAQDSRMRKKLRMEELESKLSTLVEDNRKYQLACEELTRRNSQLENRLKEVCSSQCAAALSHVASAHFLNHMYNSVPKQQETQEPLPQPLPQQMASTALLLPHHTALPEAPVPQVAFSEQDLEQPLFDLEPS